MTGYGIILLAVCFVDLLTTVIGIEGGNFYEVNPFLSYFMEFGGVRALIIIKSIMNIACIAFLELAYSHLVPKKRMRIYYLTAIYSYAAVYLSAFACVNFL